MNSESRLSSVKSLDIAASPWESEFSRLCRLVCAVLDTPAAILYLVQGGHTTPRAAWGISGEAARDTEALAERVLNSRQLIVLPDARRNGGELGVGFFAGLPVSLESRGVAGVLCGISPAPRPAGLTEQQQVAFQVVAESAAYALDAYIKDHIRELQARFELVTDEADKVHFGWDLASGAIEWSDELESSFHHSPGRIATAGSFLHLVHPEDRTWVGDGLKSAAEGGLSHWSAEYRFRMGDGTYTDVLLRVSIDRDGGGNAAMMNGTVLNLAQQRSRHRKVELLAQQLTAVLESTTDAVITMDSDWTVRYANRNASEMIAEGRELAGVNFLEMFPAAPSRPFVDRFRKAMQDQQAVRFEEFHAPLHLWIEVHAYPTPDSLTLFFRDVSERRETEAALAEAHGRLQASSEKLQRMLNQSRDMFCITDAEGRIVEVSFAARTILGYEPDELMGARLLEFVDPGDRDTAAAAVGESRRGLPIRGMHSRFRSRVGELVHVLWSAVWSEPDQSTFFVARDVSESFEAIHRIRESEASLRKAQEIAHLGSWSFNQDTGASQWTPEMFKILGRTPREIVPSWEGFLQCVHPDDRADLERVVAGAAARRKLVESEHRVILPDGSTRFIHFRLEPVLGNVESVEWFGILQDITERRAMEDELRSGEQRYRLLFERSPHPMWVFEVPTLRFLAVNAAAIRQYQYSEAEFLSMTLRDIRSPSEVPALEEAVRYFPEASVESGVWRHVTKHGRRILADIRSHAIPFAGTDARLVLAWDVTEKIALEERLRQTQKMEALGQLAGGIAHDFNNLLTVINGYAEVLQEQLRDAGKPRRAVDLILDSGKRAAKLTNQLLAFSRKQVLQPTLLDLNTAIKQILPMLRSLLREGIETQTDLSSSPALITADSVQIEQVLMNLAINAKDAMGGRGKISVETKNIFLEAGYAQGEVEMLPGAYVLLSITDTGTGMTPEVRSHIFEPFFTTKGRGSGTGLGLATVHGIVTQSGGYIHVYSEPGLGTTFRIYFPAAAGKLAGENAIETVASRGGSETVLVVEDDASVREFLTTTLRENGYEVFHAANGVDAMRVSEALCKQRVDLLVTDVLLPSMNGRVLSEMLVGRRPDMRVLYVSGFTEDIAVDHGTHLGKPFSKGELLKRVRQTLDTKRRKRRVVIVTKDAMAGETVRQTLTHSGYEAEVAESLEGGADLAIVFNETKIEGTKILKISEFPKPFSPKALLDEVRRRAGPPM